MANKPARTISISQLTVIICLVLPSLTYSAVDPVQKVALKKKTAKAEVHCVVVLDNSEIRKDVGSMWVSSEDPCLMHTCEFDDSTGHVHETITVEDCEQFYCDVDSELKAVNGTCCGECVKTKCRYKDNYYDIGQTWRDAEDCLMLECHQPVEGEPKLNIYKKSCEPVASNCPPANIYTEDCCQFCRTDNPPIDEPMGDKEARVSYIEGEDTWNEEYYRNHPCNRDCKVDEEPMICTYRFVIEWYQTLSKACYDCPRNNTDCQRTHCIPVDGISRSVTVANRMMPGPAIEVCQNDFLVIDVHNDLLGETTTLHWHGMHQKDYPYMDGVPHITQCPISPHSTFRYSFKAEQSGTHFWHSHTGMQRGDGLFGAMIVRRPRDIDPHSHLYDFDLSEHKILVQDWLHAPGVVVFSDHHHSRGDNKPHTLLVNGHGRYYPGIWQQGKKEAAAAKEILQKSAASSNKLNSLLRKEYKEITRLARLVQGNMAELNETTTQQPLEEETSTTVQYEEDNEPTTTTPEVDNIQKFVKMENETLNRKKRDALNMSLDTVPLQVYSVQQGFRYRFRIINAEYLNCPIAVSVDNHVLTVISSDGYDLSPQEAGSIVTYSGERWDFVLHANQTVGNYWLRFKGLMDCSDQFTSAFQVAILRYAGAPETEPEGTLGWGHNATGLEVNAMNMGSGHEDVKTMAELNALPHYNSVRGIDTNVLKPVADYKFFIYYDFYPKDNPIFHASEYYGFNESLGRSNKVFTPQLNHISLKFPAKTLLSQRHEIDDSLFCNESTLAAQGTDCHDEFCYCHHVMQVPLDAVVELIFVDEGMAYDANHPFHLHGNAFRVLAIERLGRNVTIDTIKQLDSHNLLKRNLVNPPVKDSVTVPDGGYTIVRFQAYNPGYWLLHCHLEFHAEIGMAVVIKVGDNSEMPPVPTDFPSCGDYMPDMKMALRNNTTTSTSASSRVEATIMFATILSWLLYFFA